MLCAHPHLQGFQTCQEQAQGPHPLGTSPLTTAWFGVPGATGLWVPLPRGAHGRRTASDNVEADNQRCCKLGPMELILSDQGWSRNLNDTPWWAATSQHASPMHKSLLNLTQCSWDHQWLFAKQSPSLPSYPSLGIYTGDETPGKQTL